MLEFVLNFLFSPICVVCGNKHKNWICEKCEKRIKKYEKNYCKNTKKVFFDKIIYCFEYKGIIRKLLLQYKFSGKSYISNFFANSILNNKKINEIFYIYDIIIPIPMEKNKKRKRGYNQTELITNIISKKTGISLDSKTLKKIKITKTQSKLNKNERESNIKNAFLVNNINKIKNKKIILLDDIYTTGATVNEACKILKMAGAKEILVLIVAKD